MDKKRAQFNEVTDTMCGCQMSNAPWHFDALITVGEVDHSVSHAALVKGETERLLDETCDKT